MQIQSHPDHVTVVIGAGPAGLVTVRWLLAPGFEPVLFEAAARLEDQWNGGAPTSSTWAGMRTNTRRVMTAFSDLHHPAGTSTYSTRDEVQAYLAHYADLFGRTGRIRFRARIEQLSRASGGGRRLRTTPRGQTSDEVFARVVVAIGRNTAPELPQVLGLDTFTGSLGVFHSPWYGGVERFRGASVLIAGCSISALEIATELAQNGVEVTTAYRRQRYGLPKLVAGVPTEHVMFHRAATLVGEIARPKPWARN